MKKVKRRRYTKAELAQVKEIQNMKVLGELVGKLINQDTKDMSVAEINTAVSVWRTSKVEGSICFNDLASIPAAQDYRFRDLYLSYYGDLDGEYGIEKFTGQVTIEEKREDVIRLNEYFRDWKKIYDVNNHKDTLLNLVINESRKEYKELQNMLSNGAIALKDFTYKEKSIVLHSKYLYLTAKAFFDEHGSGEVIAKFHGQDIVINEFSFVHIFNRHLGEATKQINTNKSFHTDRTIKWFELPYDLKEILEKVGSHRDTNVSDLKFLPCKINGIVCAIWTEAQVKHQGGLAIPYRRLQSYYPVQDATELRRISDDFKEVVIDSQLSAFVPK